MSSVVAAIAAVIVMWGSWPLVARAAGEHGLAGALLLSVFSLLAIVAGSFIAGINPPDARGTIILAIAGILMGGGLVAFNAATTNRLVEVSAVIPIIDTGMLLVAVAGGILFFGEAVTVRKLVGVGLLIAGILLLGPSMSADRSG